MHEAHSSSTGQVTPNADAATVTARVRVDTDVPHVVAHGLHAPQGPTSQSTSAGLAMGRPGALWVLLMAHCGWLDADFEGIAGALIGGRVWVGEHVTVMWRREQRERDRGWARQKRK